MEARKSMKLFCLCVTLISLSVQGQIEISEIEIKEFRQETMSCTHRLLTVCPTQSREGLFVLTQCIPSDSKLLFLWKIDEAGDVLQKSFLSEVEGRPVRFDRPESMIVIPHGHLLVVDTPLRYGDSVPANPEFYDFSIPNVITGDPDLLTLAIVGEPFGKSLCLPCQTKLSLLNQESCLIFAREKGNSSDRDIFLRLDNDGNVTHKIPVFDPWVEICDFDIQKNEEIVAVVARKNITEEIGPSWRYSTGFLNAASGHILQTDVFQSDIYNVRDADRPYNYVAQELLPKIVALKDNSFLCFYSSPLNSKTVAVKVRFYSTEFKFLKEKELLKLDCGFISKELPYPNSLDVAFLDGVHFVVTVLTKGRLHLWLFDLKGNLKDSKSIGETQKMIVMYGLFSLNKSVAAVVSELGIPSERPIAREDFNESKKAIKLYSIRKKQPQSY